MRTAPSPHNPHGYTRYAYAFEALRRLRSTRHLDFGCYEGGWLASLGPLGDIELHGVDVNGDSIASGRRQHPYLRLYHVANPAGLPFADGAFDTATILDVLEHLDWPTQRTVLRELRRVLREGGHLIVTVPGKHLFSFLDFGNLKFRFPRLHRRWYVRKRGEESYRYRYVENPYGLVGDIAATKRWHEHFSRRGLRSLVEPAGFALVDMDGMGLFERPMFAIRMVLPWRQLRAEVDSLMRWDARAFKSANLFATFRATSRYSLQLHSHG